ncbi:hypothetical protein AAG570_004081 [Ranatra chinensis]|uniref:Peptidase S1 domain-containing protein n=1 Tax=Ranatra chinensis TaxID=642074 RepID=A0ABD0Y2S3_9HEMI
MVSEKFVLSAAHCAETRDLGVARWVRLGELDLSTTLDDEGLQDLVIVSRIVHPEYKWPAIYHDIALFKLRRGAVFTNWVRPVCLHNDPVIPVSTGVATGWGRTDFVGDTSPQLMEVELTLVEGEDCENLLGRSNGTRLPRGLDPEIMLCAGEKEGGKDTCSGDSGGPLVIQEVGKCLTTQVGITSFGRECGKPNSPGVYTRVSYYVPWIESIVWA